MIRLSKKKILVAIGSLSAIIFLCFIFLDAFYGRNFRSMRDPIISFQDVDVTGLRDIRASGGKAVRFWDLKRRLSDVEGTIFIVDGMAEYHGYIYGIPSTFFGYQRQGPPNFSHFVRRLVFTGSTEVQPELLQSESEAAKSRGYEYKKVNVGSKFIETDENIDEIVDFYDHLPEDAWVHFHCAHGKGRTSILLVMLDIMKNAPQVSVEEIVKRQHLLGSENLFDTDVRPNGTYSLQELQARKKFILDFYQFICQRKDGGIQRWSDRNNQVMRSSSVIQ